MLRHADIIITGMDEYRLRVRIFGFIIVLALGILGLRLAHLQIVDQATYAGESRNNAIREKRVFPGRGVMYDRNGDLMVTNAPTYTVTVTPRYFDEAKIPLLARLMEVPDSVVVNRLAEASAWSRDRMSPLFKDVPFDVLGRLLENLYRLPGVDYEVAEQRRYVTRARAAHALGYIREISDRELERMRQEGYRQGDLVGKTGVEKRYEELLRGEPGIAFRLVNVRGREVMAYKEGTEDTPPTSGYDLHLNLDARVQALAESLFVGKRGGAVAIDPKTGGIIALVSMPDYDPEIFTQPLDPRTWKWLNGYTKPLLNRATMNLMPPGSTWKPFMALMSLQTGNIKPGERVVCRGGHPIGGGRFFTCMGVHGALDVQGAIQNSCNTFFFEMMYRADPNTFSKYAHMFGFGEKAPLEIDEQSTGLIPDSAYFVNRYGPEGLKPGYTLSLGIGQGDMGVTPMQLARYVAAVANKGTLVTPHLVRELRNPETGRSVRPDIEPAKKIPIEERYFDMVREGMRRVMEAGTGRGVQIPGIPSGGKTGTAQAPGINRKDDSVFIMFAPWDDPQIAIAVQVENAGYGSSAAAPMASLMAELYLKGELPDSPEVKARMARALGARSQPLPVPPTEERAEANE